MNSIDLFQPVCECNVSRQAGTPYEGGFFPVCQNGILQPSFQWNSLWTTLSKVPMFISTARCTIQMWMRVVVCPAYKAMVNEQRCALAL